MSKPSSPPPRVAKPAEAQPKPTSRMAVTLHGREYIVACDAGDEKKLGDIVKLVDAKLTTLANSSVNATETRLFMLTCLLLADELIETRKAVKDIRKIDEDLLVAAVDHLRGRVLGITEQLAQA